MAVDQSREYIRIAKFVGLDVFYIEVVEQEVEGKALQAISGVHWNTFLRPKYPDQRRMVSLQPEPPTKDHFVELVHGKNNGKSLAVGLTVIFLRLRERSRCMLDHFDRAIRKFVANCGPKTAETMISFFGS